MTKNEQTAPSAETEGWRPNEGDTIRGPVVNVSRAWSDWTQSYYPLVTIHDENTDKDVDLHAFHHTLQSRLMEAKPKVGDMLEVTYLGKRATKDGKREVAIYRVNVPGATGEEVWNALSAQAENAAGWRPPPASDVTKDEDIPF